MSSQVDFCLVLFLYSRFSCGFCPHLYQRCSSLNAAVNTLPTQGHMGFQESWLRVVLAGATCSRGSCKEVPPTSPLMLTVFSSSSRSSLALPKPRQLWTLQVRSSCGTNVVITFSFPEKGDIAHCFVFRRWGEGCGGPPVDTSPFG